ncbi:sensor histidine kinase [Bacillus testis]|uniref:sensor histidine kinase n=1 Tax=Bacillus testis TaxID=1622072 RepID=UPI000B131210|nr:GHKL domain-containing protein [Bacillus testis]
MNRNIVYWIGAALLMAAHLYLLLLNTDIGFPSLISILIAVVICTPAARKIPLRAGAAGGRMNGLLVLVQVLLLAAAWLAKPTLLEALWILAAAGIEYSRIKQDNEAYALRREVDHMKEQREQMNETFRIVRSERHDFLKHVSVLHILLEKGEDGEAGRYLGELVESYKKTNLSIKGEKGTVAAILHDMYRRGTDKGIAVLYDLDLPLSTLPMDDKDLVALLGNVLSNSLDACEEWQHKKGEQATVVLQFYKRSGLYILTCKNDSLPIPVRVVDSLFHSYGNSTKGGDHEGLGTKIIQDIISKHHGHLDFVHSHEQFTLKLKLPAVVRAGSGEG